YDVGNLADALLRRGIPAVLAMAERIPDDVALNLSRLFYRNLKQGQAIDLSLNRARQGLLSSYGSSQLYWALPILYLHPEFDGHLRGAEGSAKAESDWEPEFPTYEDLEDPTEYDRDRPDIATLFQELVQDPGFQEASTPEHPPDPLVVPIADAEQINHFTQGQMGQDAQQFFKLAQILQQQGDLTGAIEALGDALNLDPNNPLIYHQLGMVFQAYGNLPDALRSYKLALQLDPSYQPTQAAIDQLTHASGSHGTVLAEPATEGLASLNGLSPAQKANFGDRQPEPKKPFPWAIAGSVSIAATALIGLGVTASHFLPSISSWVSTSSSPGAPTQIDPSNSQNNQQLFALATQKFQQNQISAGLEAVEQMLDQGAIVQAEEALKSVPNDQLDIAPVQFLRGRAAWESANRGGITSSRQDDARRAFEQAVQANPNDPLYQTAFGFALYEQGRLNEAIGAWLRANELVGQQTNAPNAVDAYAGLALGLMQDAKRPNNKQHEKLRQEALKLRDRALQTNAAAFTDETLGNNWLWSPKAIADWKKLAQEK
ncbi:MAG: tetratricopeptide repeat protein, partial [Synechococcales bacterium]|nr:tetratricopeptide repeat protein [Synechococcales bacterium]